MSRSSIRRASSLLAVGALTVALASTTQAAASVGSFHFEQPINDPTALPECMPADVADMVGSQEAIETTDGHFVETATGFHVEGHGNLVYRVDFPDGRYVIGSSPSHFAFDVSASGQTVNKEVIREPRTIYAADGSVLGRVMIHALSKVTYRDANGNGQPDLGEIEVQFDRFFALCR
jgi:hypothetical protein